MEAVRFNTLTHPAAARYPMMADEQLLELAEDISARGLQEPIWVDVDGYLLDGRNRLEACRLAGIEPHFDIYHGEDIEAFIVSKNEHRRHLTEKQRIELRQQRVKALRAEGKSTTTIAEEVGVSPVQVLSDLQPGSEEEPQATRVTGKDGKDYPAERRRRWTDVEAAQFLIEYRDVRTPEAKDAMRAKWGVKDLATIAWTLRKRVPDAEGQTVDRKEAIPKLAAQGMNAPQIAKELGISENTLRAYCKNHGIEITAEKTMGKVRRLNGDRIITGLVGKAFCDIESDSLLSTVDYSTLNRDRIREWVDSLAVSIKSLTTIKKRLTKELTRAES